MRTECQLEQVFDLAQLWADDGEDLLSVSLKLVYEYNLVDEELSMVLDNTVFD